MEFEKLNREIGSNDKGSYSGNVVSMQKAKSTAVGRAMVDRETKNLYSDLVDKKQAAFVSFLIFPVSLILLGILLVVIMLIYT